MARFHIDGAPWVWGRAPKGLSSFLSRMKSGVCWPLMLGTCAPLQTWEDEPMATILWIIAVILVIAGIAAILRGQMLWGIVLIVVGLLVGPGGVSVFT